MQIRLAASLQPDSIVDGPGIRTVLWTQGCVHHCLGCHNPETHDMNGGFLVDTATICEELKNIPLQDGITFSGGDPMMQPEACSVIAKCAHEIGLNVWCYTGFTFEELMMMSKTNNKIMKFLHEIDVLVDGRFILEQKSLSLKFKGSRNQRVIDVEKSLKEGKPIIIPEFEGEVNHTKLYNKDKYMYV